MIPNAHGILKCEFPSRGFAAYLHYLLNDCFYTYIKAKQRDRIAKQRDELRDDFIHDHGKRTYKATKPFVPPQPLHSILKQPNGATTISFNPSDLHEGMNNAWLPLFAPLTQTPPQHVVHQISGLHPPLSSYAISVAGQ